MGKTLRQTIKEITFKHLKKSKGQVFGQNLTSVGWVAGTLPQLYEKDGVIELPMADVAGGGIVTGAALVKKRPIYIIRYQGYNCYVEGPCSPTQGPPMPNNPDNIVDDHTTDNFTTTGNYNIIFMVQSVIILWYNRSSSTLYL